MKVSVSHRLYNSYGGHKSISLAAEIMEYDERSFGSAIEDLEITVQFYHDGPARKSLEQMQEEFHSQLQTLPKATFFRKKHRLVLDIKGTFTTGYEIEKNRKPPIQIKPDWVKATLKEIITNLPVMKSKFKKSDDFCFSDFEQHLKEKLEGISESAEELEKIQNIVRQRKKIAFERLDEWEKIGLDWDDYHPSAKDIVPYPKLWSCADEFAPNGNDTGADTLDLFTDWNKKNKGKSALVFLSKLLTDWEIDINNPYESEFSSYTYFQSVVGLAFASAKLNGECESALKEKAILAIERYLDSIVNETSWEHKNECEQTLKLSRAVLEKMASKI